MMEEYNRRQNDVLVKKLLEQQERHHQENTANFDEISRRLSKVEIWILKVNTGKMIILWTCGAVGSIVAGLWFIKELIKDHLK
jgi:hypothetical protein